MARRSIVRTRKNVEMFLSRCKLDLAPRLKFGKRINCGTQGCVYHYHSPRNRDKDSSLVVKITTAGDWKKLPAHARSNKGSRRAYQTALNRMAYQAAARRSSGRRHGQYDDYLATLKIIEWMIRWGADLHPMLPRFRTAGSVTDCLREQKNGEYFVEGPVIGHIAIREDLPNLPSKWVRGVNRARKWSESLEEALADGSSVNDWLRAKRHRMMDALSRDRFALTFMGHYIDLQQWLERNYGAYMYDVFPDNLGVRAGTRTQPAEIVVRDVGRLGRIPHRRGRVAGTWKKAALEKKHTASPLAGYEGW